MARNPKLDSTQIDPANVPVAFDNNECLIVPDVTFSGDRAINAELLHQFGQHARTGQTSFDQIGTVNIGLKIAGNTPQVEREAFAKIEELNREIVQRSLVMRRLITAMLIGGK